MKKTVKTLLLANVAALCSLGAFAQDVTTNPIITGVPSMMIAPDAKAGGMGDAGVATSPDVYSQYWNPAKYAFATKKFGGGISYTPWLRKIVNDMALLQFVGYYKIGNDDNQAISASIRYFKTGDVFLSDAFGQTMNTMSPYEMAIDLGYSRKLNNTFSMSVLFRYIRADYATPLDDGSKAGNAFAADIAGYNESYIKLFNRESLLSFGFNISNIGTKIDNGGLYKHFLPANLRIGASILQPIDDVNSISLSFDINKLLVQMPPMRKGEESDESFRGRMEKYSDRGALSSMFRSFGDGFKNEMKDLSFSVGAEYKYNNLFMVRTGYFHENKDRGNRQYVTFGAGVRWKYLQFDGAYVLATRNSNPLDQTFRLSLAFDM